MVLMSSPQRASDVVTISSIDPGFERPGIVLRMQ